MALLKTTIKQVHHIKPTTRKVLYKNAVKAAGKINLDDKSTFCFMDGSFIYGDFLEAFFVDKNIHTKELIISTLSMSENNIYNLKNLIKGGYVDKIILIISDYFFRTERRKLIKVLLNELDPNELTLHTVRTHTKILQFKTDNDQYITISGSANLRTSANYEQVTIFNDKLIYDINLDFHKQLTKNFGKGNGKNKSINDEYEIPYLNEIKCDF